jgi:hypothetical protein
VSVKQSLLAFAANGMFMQFGGRNAIHAIAMRTDYVLHVAHDVPHSVDVFLRWWRIRKVQAYFLWLVLNELTFIQRHENSGKGPGRGKEFRD